MASTVWRGYITFGLISIPVRLFRAARSERVNLRQLYRVPSEINRPVPPIERTTAAEAEESESGEDETSIRSRFRAPQFQPVHRSGEDPLPETLAPVRRVAMSRTNEDVLQRSELTKGYEYEKGHFVSLGEEELKRMAPKNETEMQITEFVRLEDIDPIYFETSYFVKPEEAGEKAYALLFKSIQETGLVALARFAMHNREHIVILRSGKSGIISHTMYFSSEVRAEQEYAADTTFVSRKDLELANALVSSLKSDFNPAKYKDTYREKVEALIAAKLEGKQTGRAAESRQPAPVVDLTEALRKSLAVVKKPAKSATDFDSRESSTKQTRSRKGRTR